MSQKNRAIIFITEGDTDAYFYEQVLTALDLKQRFIGRFKIINSKSVAKIQNKGFNKCREYIKDKKISTAYIFVCFDEDVFHRNQKPPLNYAQLKTRLKGLAGVELVEKIVATKQIEDWFLLDLEGICQYLNIKVKDVSGTGEERLKQLFKKANKVYVKGRNIENGKFIDSLDMDLVTSKMKAQLTIIEKIITSSLY